MCLNYLISLPNAIRINLSNVEPDGSRNFVQILTFVIFGEFGLCGLKERCFAGIVQAKNKNIEVVLLRPGLPQSREQRVHIAVHVHFTIRVNMGSFVSRCG